MLRIKEETLNGQFEYIVGADPALDVEAEGFKESFEQYKDGSIPLPLLKEGVQPTRFILSPCMTADLETRLAHTRFNNPEGWFMELATYGIASVVNFELENGADFEVEHTIEKGIKRLDKASRDILKPWLLEIGYYIFNRSSPN